MVGAATKRVRILAGAVMAAESAEGERTIEARAAPKPLRLFCGWFCPYAQRAWIALEEKGADYQYVPIMPYAEDSSKPGGYSKNPLSLEEKRSKFPDFMAASPKGLVPAIEYTFGTGRVDRVHDSLVCVEYVDETLEGPALLPPLSAPAQRAHVRVWAAFASDEVIPHFYRMLMKKGAEDREEEKRLIVEGLGKFAGAMAPISASGGAYFLGDRFSAADVALIPWWHRFHSIGYVYRQLQIPTTGGNFPRLTAWADACCARSSVARTIVDQQRLTDNYSGYADSSATSTVAMTLTGGPQ